MTKVEPLVSVWSWTVPAEPLYTTFMEIVKLGKSGQVSLPRALVRSLGLVGDARLSAERTADGGILLRPLGIYPIEVYSDERIGEFMEADMPTAAERRRVKRRLDAPLP